MERDLTDLIALFGQSAVDDAIAHELEAGEYAFAHSDAIAETSAALSNTLDNPQATVAYAASLDPELKRALIVVIMNA